MTILRKLEVEEVKRCAREAYDNKMLIAQKFKRIVRYFYRKKSGVCCAIGAALTYKEAFDINNTGSLFSLIEMGYIKESDYSKTELKELREIQDNHDRWAGSQDLIRKDLLEKKFLDSIDYGKN